MKASRKDRTDRDGTIVVSREASAHLWAALRQMDLLLATKQVEVALRHMVEVLRHLQAFRQAVS